MDRRIFDIPVVYRNEGFAPRSRWHTEFLAVGKAAIAIPVADPSDVDPVLVYREKVRSGGMRSVPFMHYRGLLMRPLAAPSPFGVGRTLGVSDIAALEGADIADVPEALRPPSYIKEYAAARPRPRDSLNPKRIRTDGFAAAVDELQLQVDRNVVIVGEEAYARCPDPCWAFRKRLGDWFADILFSPDGDFTLPGHRADLAREFVDWARHRHGIEFQMPWHREIEALSTHVPYAHNPVVGNAASLARDVFRHRQGSGIVFDLVDAASAACSRDAGVAEALAFVSAVEKLAANPAAPDISHRMGNALWVEFFWKAYELLPEGYKVDPGDEELLAPPSP